MAVFISDTPLARELIRIGDEAIARENDAALRKQHPDRLHLELTPTAYPR
ncbi:MAG TPA: hypothetical protein VI462_01060 [Acidimicrobiia bacterium]